jgi:TetR/AcrR family transcriptional regulator
LSTIWLEMHGRRTNGTKPQRRDPAATRQKLLTAARREFAASGLAGARVDEIAARAGVNKQLVYHYFGDKDALYLAVLEWVYEEIREHERKLNLEGLAPELAIRKLIESSFDHLAAHPDFILLLNDENRGGARHVRNSSRLEAMHSPLVSLVSKILSEGVRKGVFRKGVNPVQLYISIAGLSYFFFSNNPTLSAIFGKDLSRPSERRARRHHVVDLVMQSLRP